ncbi:hypothetical protein ADIARSV_1247 [Arcticibacter svalbardensis MN12-7]|uniref:Uncharacterized protein n=1 Tax=Arcticibacter svalbardensis MN12-7 TaxID=1150600 RepID=R9H2Z3_9SPHI|nr:hypothetical protein ADIARSV_1247 [Arcticibacter svalbardensis MN12-7]
MKYRRIQKRVSPFILVKLVKIPFFKQLPLQSAKFCILHQAI